MRQSLNLGGCDGFSYVSISQDAPNTVSKKNNDHSCRKIFFHTLLDLYLIQ